MTTHSYRKGEIKREKLNQGLRLTGGTGVNTKLKTNQVFRVNGKAAYHHPAQQQEVHTEQQRRHSKQPKQQETQGPETKQQRLQSAGGDVRLHHRWTRPANEGSL